MIVNLIIFCMFQKRSKAQNLLDKVFDHLELIEKDYFGLQFLDLSPDPESMVRDKMVGTACCVALFMALKKNVLKE